MNTPSWEAGGWTALVAWRGGRAHREIASQHVEGKGARVAPSELGNERVSMDQPSPSYGSASTDFI